MTFYLKYRPQKIGDLDITSVRESIQKYLNSDDLPHAFLFAGPKGTGKTSAARIIAKVINCEKKDKDGNPCNKCSECQTISNGSNIDVVEMDAASNRGIDDIRVLRDSVKLSPSKSKAKVYIIDEAHMLTTEASNALLKTLEEPPSHVFFILATTNPEKLIETIRSRTTLIQFKKATVEETKRSLERIVKAEKIKIDNDKLLKIIKLSKGSFRDATKLLEQFSKDSNILDTFFGFSEDEFLKSLETKDTSSILEMIEQSLNSGMGIDKITELILEILKNKLTESLDLKISNEYISLISLILKNQEYLKYSPIEELPLELSFIAWANGQGESSTSDSGKGDGGLTDSQKPKEAKPTESLKVIADSSGHIEVDVEKPGDVIEEIKENVVVVEDKKKVQVEKKDNLTDEISDIELEKINPVEWSKFLSRVRSVNASIEGLLRSSNPLGVDSKNRLKLGVYYKFHKEKIEEAKVRTIIEDALYSVFGRQLIVNCELKQNPVNNNKGSLTEVKDNNILNVAKEIFS